MPWIIETPPSAIIERVCSSWPGLTLTRPMTAYMPAPSLG
jgi:hypothetical protein